jgi:hypothetical protein
VRDSVSNNVIKEAVELDVSEDDVLNAQKDALDQKAKEIEAREKEDSGNELYKHELAQSRNNKLD